MIKSFDKLVNKIKIKKTNNVNYDEELTDALNTIVNNENLEFHDYAADERKNRTDDELLSTFLKAYEKWKAEINEEIRLKVDNCEDLAKGRFSKYFEHHERELHVSIQNYFKDAEDDFDIFENYPYKNASYTNDSLSVEDIRCCLEYIEDVIQKIKKENGNYSAKKKACTLYVIFIRFGFSYIKFIVN